MRESATNYTKRARARIMRGLEACARRAQVGGARIHGSKCKIQVHFLSAHEKICAHGVRRGIKYKLPGASAVGHGRDLSRRREHDIARDHGTHGEVCCCEDIYDDVVLIFLILTETVIISQSSMEVSWIPQGKGGYQPVDL